MFETLYEDSVKYDDNLLQAACALQADFDIGDLRDLAIIKVTPAFKLRTREVSDEYGVARRDVLQRLREICEE